MPRTYLRASTMEKIDVIIPCWIVSEELQQLTKAAIDSLGDVNLIIIDNASTQGGGWLRSVANVYVRNQENLGYAAAVNQGLKLAQSNLIAVANNDIIVSPNWQEVAQEVLNDPNIYSCHFRMLNYTDKDTYGDKVFKTGKERWCTSSFFVINKEKALFYYDENYFNSYEDWEYWMIVRKAGFKTAYTNKAFYKHMHSSTQKYNATRDKDTEANREYFKEKWGQYAEELFAMEFPEQMNVDYGKGFE